MLEKFEYCDGCTILMNPADRLPTVGAKVTLLVKKGTDFEFIDAIRTRWSNGYDAKELHYEPIDDKHKYLKLGRYPWVYKVAFDSKLIKNNISM